MNLPSRLFYENYGRGWIPRYKIDLACIAFLLLLATSLRLIWFAGLHGHDDWIYLFYTRSYQNDQTAELLNSLWGLRFLIWFPIHLWFQFFGVSLPGAFAPGFILGLLCIPITWIALRQMDYGKKVAFAGCIFLIFNPIDWMAAGTIRGDIEMSFYGGLILVLLLGMHQTRGRVGYAWGFGIGIAWGLAALTKEWGYIFAWGFFLVALYTWIHTRRVPWPYSAVALGFIITWAADAALLRQLTGDWLHRVQVSVGWYQRAADDGGYVGDPSVHYRYMLDLFLGLKTDLTRSDGFSANHYPYFGPYMWLLIAAYLIVGWRRGAARLVSLFVLGLLLWIEFGSMSWKEYLPYHKEPRYFSLISVPAAVLMAAAAARVFTSTRPRAWRLAAGGAILLILFKTALIVDYTTRQYRAYRDFLPEVEAWLAKQPETRLWLPPSLQQELDLRLGYRFADPVHKHPGQAGWGTLQDIDFWTAEHPGEMILANRVRSEFTPLYPHINPQRFTHIKFFRGKYDMAELLQHVPRAYNSDGYGLYEADPLSVRQTYGKPGWNLAFDHAPLMVDGQRMYHGIGVHSRSEIQFKLEPEFPLFSAKMALLDSGVGVGSVVFSVIVDDQPRYRSPIVHARGQIEAIQLDLSGASILTLVVEDAGDGPNHDHAVWLEPRLSPREATPEKP